MLNNVRRKIVQKDIKKYSALKVNEWWNVDVGSHIFQYSHSGNQRYSKKKIDKPFKNQSLKLVPYYKVNDEIYNMILCPSSSFWKGGSQSKTPGNLKEKMNIEKSFLLGETEVTQELYESIMGVYSSNLKHPKNPKILSWYDALIFCNRLSDVFGLDRYYTITKDGKILDTIEPKQAYVVEMHENSKGFRLPTEWEWEYAAKADTKLLYSGSDDVNEVGWHFGNAYRTTQPIKQKKPNAWGFYDMSGNLSEWCENTYTIGDEHLSASRVTRGGSCSTYSPSLLVAFRDHPSSPWNRAPGFRICKYL